MTNLKRIRMQNGLTQRELAEKSGVNIRMIQKYETGEKDINSAKAVTVFKLSYILQCDMLNLLECTKKPLKDIKSRKMKQNET